MSKENLNKCTFGVCFPKTSKKGLNGPKSSKILPSAESLSPYDHLWGWIFILIEITYTNADYIYLIAFEI